MANYLVLQLLAPGGIDVGLVQCTQHGREDLRAPDCTGAAFQQENGLAGEWMNDRRKVYGLRHRQRQLPAPLSRRNDDLKNDLWSS